MRLQTIVYVSVGGSVGFVVVVGIVVALMFLCQRKAKVHAKGKQPLKGEGQAPSWEVRALLCRIIGQGVGLGVRG